MDYKHESAELAGEYLISSFPTIPYYSSMKVLNSLSPCPVPSLLSHATEKNYIYLPFYGPVMRCWLLGQACFHGRECSRTYGGTSLFPVTPSPNYSLLSSGDPHILPLFPALSSSQPFTKKSSIFLHLQLHFFKFISFIPCFSPQWGGSR